MPMTALTRGGTEYIPEFLMAIDAEKCIGCGRCYKVCGRDVMGLGGYTEDGALLIPGTEEFEEDEDEIIKRVMVMTNADACIGCGACNRVCPSDCQTHAPLDA
ncbi:ferredoxin III, nif-specific [Mangrovicoccus sp. HB161399]|uniref:ferredoxin III, nif-specific n=1 Tax=Mangrovicoccus sp. HB161399 TaxID=2720392 RepID=UPI001552B447|nr:ferredoxin III, nif-specific [Mangrovicoccus sp. HB161399]